jgi:TonB family protein
VVLADAEASAASPENAGLENQAISDSLVVATTQAPKSANETIHSRATAVDTAAMTGQIATASVASKVKMRSLAPANGQESARVLATPMPTAPAIKPAPVGGTPAFREYLRRQAAEFVPEDNARPLSGIVRVKFVVGADGKISDLKVTRGLRPDYDQEALRLVCDGPAWKPGISGGRRAPIPVEFSVPF